MDKDNLISAISAYSLIGALLLIVCIITRDKELALTLLLCYIGSIIFGVIIILVGPLFFEFWKGVLS